MYTNAVYIDILVVLNVYVSFFLIKATDVILHRRTGRKNIMAAVLIGGLSSLAAVLPQFNFALTVSIKILSCIVISLAIFGFKNKYIFLKNTIIFLIINFIFAGIMLFLWNFISPFGMIYNNGYVYFNVSFTFIAVSSSIAYGIVKGLRYIIDTKFSADKKYNIKINNNNSSVTINAFPDTGNTLSDFYTGLPVIICSKSSCDKILSDNMKSFNYENCTDNIKGIRLVPYSTIGKGGIIPVFKPDSIEINEKPISALIGITDSKINGEVDAVFNPKLLI